MQGASTKVSETGKKEGEKEEFSSSLIPQISSQEPVNSWKTNYTLTQFLEAE